MRPTRRGYATLALVVVALWAGLSAGPRALNAVVMPAVVVAGYGWLSLRRRAPPTVTRTQPTPGFPGETRDIELRAESDGPVTTTDSVGDRLVRRGDRPGRLPRRTRSSAVWVGSARRRRERRTCSGWCRVRASGATRPIFSCIRRSSRWLRPDGSRDW
ncbi:MAG: hypothetical protein U5K28_01655 [Halobacteriales archaeon]|nr:hypothetical protein [Halobacteriales archaeon]